MLEGYDYYNNTRMYRNISVDGSTHSLLLANLTSGVTYYITIAAATKIGLGPFSKASIVRVGSNMGIFDSDYTAR